MERGAVEDRSRAGPARSRFNAGQLFTRSTRQSPVRSFLVFAIQMSPQWFAAGVGPQAVDMGPEGGVVFQKRNKVGRRHADEGRRG